MSFSTDGVRSPAIDEHAELASEVIRTMHEERLSAKSAAFSVIVRRGKYSLFESVLEQVNRFIDEHEELRSMLESQLKSEERFLTTPFSHADATFRALSEKENKEPVMEIPRHVPASLPNGQFLLEMAV